MAQYRCQLKDVIGRSKGGSAVRSAAYIARTALHDDRTGEDYDFSRAKNKALFVGIYAPKNAPDWTQDIEKLVNEIERAEKRKDSQLAQPVELSLAHELTVEQNRWMMQEFIKENFTRKGYATLAAIHEPPEGGDPRNIHAHLLVSLRTINENGFAKTKTEQQDLFMNRSERTEALRQSWEKHLKKQLERHGFHEQAAQVSCKSLKEQGIDREPGIHLGPNAAQIEKKGRKTERGELNREVTERNRQREELKAAEKEISQAIPDVQRQLDAEIKEQQAAAQRKLEEEARRQKAEMERKAAEEVRRQKAEVERRAQELRERNEAAAEAMRKAWNASQRDPIQFMIGLNEGGLYVARDARGRYAAVERNGFAHHLPEKDMHAAIDALRRENSGLIIPTIEEQRGEQQKKREKEMYARERKQQHRAAHMGSTLYDRADMVSMQRDAMRHIQDAHRQQEFNRQKQEAERQQQEREARIREARERELKHRQEAQQKQQREQQERAKELRAKQERERLERERQQREAQRAQQEKERRERELREKQERERQERERQQKEVQKKKEEKARREREERERQEKQRREADEREQREKKSARDNSGRDQAAEKRGHKRAATEQTDYQQRRAERDKLREQMGLRRQGGSERDGGGRERERER